MADRDEIAIVGVGCRFPGADNLKEYWRVLKNGENHVKEVPRDRWNIDAFYDPDRNAPGKTVVRTAGFVKGIDQWDHRLYGINDMEAELVDPQQRIVLDCVHMALEDGGITRKDIEGTHTGVYIGSMTDDYKSHVMGDTTISSAYSVTGTHSSIISARVSYVYNLCGPAITIDTACSSSLVAIDLASQALHSGKCDMAICGGVNVLMDPQMFIALAKAGMLSPGGQCKTFTIDADGYARGEGCGIVLVKTLKTAIKDGNKIWGTIKTGTNQDGHMAAPITAPSGLQQERLIKDVYYRNNIDRARIRIIEAHGTGTSIGDPTEVNALGSQFGRKAKAPDTVFIGSVKTNIGHLEAAAGVAGLIKVLLMMKNNTIVPSLWYTKENENPKIKLAQHGFTVPMKCTPWERTCTEKKRIACVNSFGFGGTNAHVIVEEYDLPLHARLKSPIFDGIFPCIITISAFDKASLVENVRHIYEDLKSEVYDLKALSYTSICRRDHRPQKKAIFGETQDQIIATCSDVINSKGEDILLNGAKKMVFVFCGVGTAWDGMCNELMKLDPFRQTIDDIDKHLKPLAGWSIASKFTGSKEIVKDPLVAHIAIFACQLGLAAIWKHFNIIPDYVIGQSVGEVAAAYTAGYLHLQSAVKIIFYRSKFLAAVKSGRMAVIQNVDVGVVERCCESSDSVTVAVYSSPKSCTISGTSKGIEQVMVKLPTIENIKPECTDLDVMCAYHTSHVENASKQLENELKTVFYQKGQIPMISTVTGQMETNGVFGTSSYWQKNVRMPVQLSNAVKSLESDASQNVFLEIGPSPVLRAHIKHILTESKNYCIVPSSQKNKEINTFAGALCKLYEIGFDINLKWLFPCQSQLTDIPTYQFRKYKQLYQSPSAIKKNQGLDATSVPHMYIKQLPQKEDGAHFKLDIDEKATPFVFDHYVTGLIIIPGATYADVGFEIGTNVLGLEKRDTVVSMEFLRPVRVKKGGKTVLHISTVEQNGDLLFHAKQNQVTMCKGWVRSSKAAEHDSTDSIDIERLKLSVSNFGSKVISMKEVYDLLESLGFKYGPYFTLIRNSVTNGTESLSEIELPGCILNELEETTMHPCVLDSMIQSTIITTNGEVLSKIKTEKLSFLPVAVGELRVFRRAEKRMFVFTKRINTTILETVLQVHYNMLLFNVNGAVIADLRNYCTYGKRNESLAPCELKYQLTWHPVANIFQPDNTDTRSEFLVLTNQYVREVDKELQDLGNMIVVQNIENMSFKDYVAKAFQTARKSDEKPFSGDAVLFLIDEFKSAREMTNVLATAIHDCVRNNCMLLVELVKYMTNNSITSPLYIATQNTQPAFFLEDSSTINLVGEELWGFVRSITLEFIHGDITLVDLQPSFRETKMTLLRFMADTSHNLKEIKPEIIIRHNKVYGAQFTKVTRNEIIPILRTETRTTKSVLSPQKVLTLRSGSVDSVMLSATTQLPQNIGRENMRIRVRSVCVHPVSIYPVTTSGVNLEQDIWADSINGGHRLLGLEYTGIPVSSNKGGRISCRNPETRDKGEDFLNRWEVVCIDPKEITTDMLVPKSCTVSVKDIPFYQPGLLLYTMLSWRLAEKIPKHSSVVIFSRHQSSPQHKMLERLLRSKRSAHLIDPSKATEDPGQWIDILISMEKLDSSFPLLGRCRHIICLEESMGESVAIKVSRSTEQTSECLNTASLLDKKYVSKCLPAAVSWLQKNHQDILSKESSEDFVYDDADCTIPCRSVAIMKDQHMSIPVRSPIENIFNKNAIYIVTGGLTGLGWELVLLLAEMGAGVIATISRRSVSPEKQEDISKIQNDTGCKIICTTGDVTELTSVYTALKSIENMCKLPVRGVFHGAGTLMGKLLMHLDESHLDFVLQPKVIGTLNMHIATQHMDLDYFVVSSSINSLIGSPGQSSYGAANSFLDTFMKWRRQMGLAGQAINWGALSVGMASRPEFVENFAKRGFSLLSVLEIQSCFQEAMMRNSTGIIYSNINWDLFAKDFTNPKLERTRHQMSILIEQAASRMMILDNDGIDEFSFDIQALKLADKERQLLAITHVIQKVSSKVVGGDLTQIKMSSTLAELSFDSMSTVTFINVVHELTGYRIAPSFMLEPSQKLDDIVCLLHDHLFSGRETPDISETATANVNDNTTGLPKVKESMDGVLAPVEI